MSTFQVGTDDQTLCDIVRHWAARQPGAPAFVEEGKAPLTYGALAKAMEHIGQGLRDAGFKRGDRIALVHSSGQFMAAVMLGIVDVAPVVPLNPNLKSEEFAATLQGRGATALVVGADSPTAAREAADSMGIPVLSVGEGADGLPALTGSTPSRDGGAPGNDRSVADDTAFVLTTSGTTSTPKILHKLHRLLLKRARKENEFLQRTQNDICLCPQQLHYGNGINQLAGSITSGGCLALVPAFSVETFFRYLSTFGITCVAASVPFLYRVHESMAAFRNRSKQHSLRYIRAGSGFLDPTTADELETYFGVPVLESYSCSEAGWLSANPFPPAKRKRGTVGFPTHYEIRIRSLDGEFMPAGQRGEIVVRGEGIIEGYENNPEANAQAFVDGWYRTGDEGFFDDEGYLTLTGRIKDVINRGGEKVSPSEVDAVLAEHPDIVEAATFAIPHRTLGEEVAAAIVLAPGAMPTEKDLSDFLLDKIAGFKVPRRFVFVDEIPKSEAGRLQRRHLANAFAPALNAPSTDTPASGRAPSPLERQLQRIWRKTLKVPDVGLDDNFFLLGGDSLQAVELFLEIETQLKRRLPPALLFETGTIAEMARLIETVETRGDGNADSAAGRPSTVVAMNAGGNLPTIFAVGGNGGSSIGFAHLARRLGANQPFFGLDSIGLDGTEEPLTRMEDIAAEHIRRLRAAQPEGPYYLIGACFGGRVAYEMAQQMRREGLGIGLLILLDPSPPFQGLMLKEAQGRGDDRTTLSRSRATRLFILNRLKLYWSEFRALEPRDRYRLARQKLRLIRDIVATGDLYRESQPERYRDAVFRANKLAGRAYVAQPYPGPVALFWSQDRPLENRKHRKEWLSLLANTVTVEDVPGHDSGAMLLPHNVGPLAEKIAARLGLMQHRKAA